MSLQKTIKAMREHSEQVKLPEAYKGDLEADFRILERYGDIRYLWVLRKNGSLLFPLKKGINTAFVDWHVRNDATCRFFVLDGYAPKRFKEVTKNTAHGLIHSKPIDFKQIFSREELTARINELLLDENVTMPLFKRPALTVDDDWSRWQQWFSAENMLMEAVMAKAIVKYKELEG
ncbi:hypothetical protein EHW61_16645 [Salinivibrio sp. VYel6]|uniref:hypothetical protein n=1 Tax=Salinivibrio sp. VYel6 TaxID=2490493 RepID=UPI00128DD74B|nr:hypothetical protein [Salinivibrio sp. VYel6]MPX98255.1 hypothetical protein [Salinivibrio sp. VYel6]